MRKKILKVFGIVAGTLVAALAVYVIYLFASYSRIQDRQVLEVETPQQEQREKGQLTTEQEYGAVTYNIGFGAYTPDFSFFMDGGKSSWAKSKESVI